MDLTVNQSKVRQLSSSETSQLAGTEVSHMITEEIQNMDSNVELTNTDTPPLYDDSDSLDSFHQKELLPLYTPNQEENAVSASQNMFEPSSDEHKSLNCFFEKYDAGIDKYYERQLRIIASLYNNPTERNQKIQLVIDEILGYDRMFELVKVNITEFLYEEARDYVNKPIVKLYVIHKPSFVINVLNKFLHWDPNPDGYDKYINDFMSTISTYDSNGVEDNQKLFNSLEDWFTEDFNDHLSTINYKEYYKKYIDFSERGMAIYFADQVKGSVVTPSTTGTRCYVWDPNTALWDSGDEHTLVKLVNSHACPLIEHVLKYAKDNHKSITFNIDVVKNTIKNLIKESKPHQDEDEELKKLELKAKPFDKIIKRCNVMRDRFNTVTTMRNIAKMAILYLCDKSFDKKLNSIGHLIPVRNGIVVDLRTGLPRSRTKEDMFTMEFDVAYNPNVGQEWMDKVEKLFSDIMLGDPVMIDFLKTVLGYGISGDTSMKMFFIFWNDLGNNGKSTILKFLELIMGEFYRTANKQVFMASKASSSGAAEPHKADLLYRRIVTLSETSTDGKDKLNEDFLKGITGGDTQSTRNVYATQMNLIPYMKPILVCNSLPKASTDPALKARAIIVKFQAYFTKNPDPNNKFHRKEDPELRTKLMDENFKSAGLLWLIQGAMKFYQSGISVPDSVTQEINTYFNSQDPVLSWISECCIINNKDDSDYTLVRDLRASFEAWCTDNERSKLSATAFGTYLTEKLKLKKGKKEGGNIAYFGIKFNPDNEETYLLM